MGRQVKNATSNPPRLDDVRSVLAAMRRDLRPDAKPRAAKAVTPTRFKLRRVKRAR